MAKLRPLPHPSVPVVDPASGRMTTEWFLYFTSREKAGLNNLADVSETAPTNGQKLTFNSTTKLWEPA